jgi:hypothetical protein
MKKYCLSFLIVVSYILAFTDAGNATIQQKTILPAEPDGYAVAAFHFPHAELEIFTLRDGGGSQATPCVKKVSADKGSSSRHSIVSTSRRLNTGDAVNFLYAKSYLVHIYPSHNFW